MSGAETTRYGFGSAQPPLWIPLSYRSGFRLPPLWIPPSHRQVTRAHRFTPFFPFYRFTPSPVLPLKIPDIPGQRQQKIPLQNTRPGILHKHITHRSADGLVLAEEVVGADAEFAVAVFA